MTIPATIGRHSSFTMCAGYPSLFSWKIQIPTVSVSAQTKAIAGPTKWNGGIKATRRTTLTADPIIVLTKNPFCASRAANRY